MSSCFHYVACCLCISLYYYVFYKMDRAAAPHTQSMEKMKVANSFFALLQYKKIYKLVTNRPTVFFS